MAKWLKFKSKGCCVKLSLSNGPVWGVLKRLRLTPQVRLATLIIFLMIPKPNSMLVHLLFLALSVALSFKAHWFDWAKLLKWQKSCEIQKSELLRKQLNTNIWLSESKAWDKGFTYNFYKSKNLHSCVMKFMQTWPRYTLQTHTWCKQKQRAKLWDKVTKTKTNSCDSVSSYLRDEVRVE